MKIQWDSSIGIGVPHLDQDHKRLIDLLNYIEANPDLDVKSEAISLIVEQLREYASTHFRREEKYMSQIAFPDLDAHRRAHKQFREKTAALCLKVMQEHRNIRQEIHRFLYDWVSEHILREDKQIQAYRDACQTCGNSSN